MVKSFQHCNGSVFLSGTPQDMQGHHFSGAGAKEERSNSAKQNGKVLILEFKLFSSEAARQVSDGSTPQQTAGQQPPSIHQQRQLSTNHTPGWGEAPPLFTCAIERIKTELKPPHIHSAHSLALFSFFLGGPPCLARRFNIEQHISSKPEQNPAWSWKPQEQNNARVREHLQARRVLRLCQV